MKAILVIDNMPKNCWKCDLNCVYKNIMDDTKRPENCPLKPIPQKKSHKEYSWNAEKIEITNDYEDGWNACLKEIEK